VVGALELPFGRMVPRGGSAGSRVYKIAEIAAELGVSIPTLRSWERRYRVVTPVRTGGGHRRYSEEDVGLRARWRVAVARQLIEVDHAISLGMGYYEPTDLEVMKARPKQWSRKPKAGASPRSLMSSAPRFRA
jgi:MerR HTH family regulatory protein